MFVAADYVWAMRSMSTFARELSHDEHMICKSTPTHAVSSAGLEDILNLLRKCLLSLEPFRQSANAWSSYHVSQLQQITTQHVAAENAC